MYSKRVIAQNVDRMSKLLGFQLEYHSIEQVDDQIRRLDALLNEEGRLKRPLSSEEIQWITNERMLSKLDFRYFATRYVWVKHYSEPKVVRFVPNIAQEVVLMIWAELEEQRKPIEIQQLKARQLGVSTLTEIAVAHRTQFYTHVNSVVASSDPDKSALMAQMMELCWQKQPWWLLPRETSYRQGLYIEFGDMNSMVSIQHGTQFTGIGRGATPNVVHLSELADYDNPEDIVDAGLLRAIHPSRWTFLVFESTASGRRNWWHRTWEYSKQNWKTGRARLYPMFLPWFIGRDIYPTETWIYSHPIPADWEPSQLTLHHAERAEAYVKANDHLRRILGNDWTLPVEQMWYWEVTRDEYAAKKELAQFYSEMPADDLEAFQSTNTSAFDADILTEYREYTRPPLAVYGFIASEKDIPKRMQPDRREIDPNQKIITVTSNWNPSIEKFSCQLVPLKFNGYPGFDPLGKLLIWEYPEENEVYGLGVDTGDGVGLDRSTIECLRKGSIEKNDAQVAEFASAYINSRDLWPLCMAVGTLFSPRINGEVHQARMAIDCLRNGENVQFELQKRGWWNHHPWLRYDKRRVRAKDAVKVGVFSNSWFRAMMMDDITKAIKDQWIDLNSPFLIDEMADLERDDVRQSMKACYGANDDRIIALAQIHFSLHILEIRGSEQSIASERVGRRESETVDPVYSNGYQDNDRRYRNWSTREELEERVSRWNE